MEISIVVWDFIFWNRQNVAPAPALEIPHSTKKTLRMGAPPVRTREAFQGFDYPSPQVASCISAVGQLQLIALSDNETGAKMGQNWPKTVRHETERKFNK